MKAETAASAAALAANYWHKRALRTARERDGVPVVVKEYPDWTFFVRPEDEWNRDWHRALARQSLRVDVQALVKRQTADDYEPTAADEALDLEIMARAFGEGCVSGWKGVTDETGGPLEFAPKNVNALFDHFPDIVRALRRVARDPSNFDPTPADAQEAAVRGNSLPASGSASGRGGKRPRR